MTRAIRKSIMPRCRSCAVLLWLLLAPLLFVRCVEQPSPVFSTVSEIAAVVDEPSFYGVPVRLNASIRYSDPGKRLLFIEDGTAGMYIAAGEAFDLATAGKRVLIEGIVAAPEHGLSSVTITPVENDSVIVPLPAADVQVDEYDCVSSWVKTAVRRPLKSADSKPVAPAARPAHMTPF